MDTPLPHRSSATRGPGTGIGVAVLLLILLPASTYAYSRSFLLTAGVFFGLVAIGALLVATLRSVVS